MTKYVCDQCVNDPILADDVRSEASEHRCSYCKRKGKHVVACDLDVLIPAISEAIDIFYDDDVAMELPWDSEDGCYFGTVYEIEDVLGNLGFSPEHQELFDSVCEYFPDTQYAQKGYYPGTPDERSMTSWRYFCRMIQHDRRYTFWSDVTETPHWIDIAPSKMIASVVSTMKSENLLKPIPAGRRFWRVRVHDPVKEPLVKDSEFTTVPHERAKDSNRMSPAGIPMFYGADDFHTACLETVDPLHPSTSTHVTGVCFETVVPINVLDLTMLPQARSGFEKWSAEKWHDVRFLREFVKDLSRPIVKDGRHHIEYVPTQALTEYVRYEIKRDDEPMHGIFYPSSKDQKCCAVLFATQEQCLPGAVDQLLAPANVERRVVDLVSLEKTMSSDDKPSSSAAPS